MKKQRITRKRDIFTIVILTLVFILLQIILLSLNRFNLEMYRGVLSSLQYGVCLLMLIVNRKFASRTAISLMSFVLVFVSLAVLHHSPNSVPGLFNAIFYLITLILISYFQQKREIENKTDMITNAYNRKGLYGELENLIETNKEFSIIYIYLDNFKTINDGHGHAYGDEFLRKIIKRIKLRFDHDCVTARLGGAEFVVIVEGKKDVKEIANRLIETITEKLILIVDDKQIDFYPSCYVGISNYPKDAEDYEALIKHADIAMMAAKDDKSKEAYVFNESMLENLNYQAYIEKNIKEGLIKQNFYLVFQPQYEITQKKLRGFETLIRLKTSSGKIITPDEFIPVAEMNDLIFKIDDYVLNRALSEFKPVIDENPELTISVNVSAKDFASLFFVEKIKRLLKETKFPAKNLEIEITEYCMVNSMDITTSNIENLRNIGIKIALDDFGTGYTSLDYVLRLPINLLKLDKSLISDIESNNKRRDFVHAIINMGRLMDCEVITEGVENDNQINYLKDFGCNYIQGYIWGKPLPYNEAKKLVEDMKN